MDNFSGNFIEFSKAAILTLLSDRLKQKTVRTAFPDNLTSSHSEKIEENSQETSRVEEFFCYKLKKYTITDVFLRIFSTFSVQLF